MNEQPSTNYIIDNYSEWMWYQVKLAFGLSENTEIRLVESTPITFSANEPDTYYQTEEKPGEVTLTFTPITDGEGIIRCAYFAPKDILFVRKANFGDLREALKNAD